MKVQRSLNSYENYDNMKYYPDALNALLVGLKKYDENIETARNLEIEKGSLPVSCYAFFDEIEERSVIEGTEVKIAEADGYYYAQFMYKDAGFQIIGQGLTESEFVDVIASLIK